MHKGFLHTHYLVVTLFFFLYVVKTILLLSDKKELLQKFSKKTRVFEMIVSCLFLITGIYLTIQLPFGSKYDYLFWIKIMMVFGSIPLAVIGFKKHNKVLAALSLLLLTGSYGLAEVYSKKKNIGKEELSGEMANDGKALYENKCAMCHGNDGKLQLAGALDISITNLDEKSIKEIILNGRNSMVPVNVSGEQADLIATYVFGSIRKGPSPNIDTQAKPDSLNTPH